MKRLTLIRGLPGSGKTTLGMAIWHRHSALNDGVVGMYAADDFFDTPEGYVYVPEKIGAAHKQCQVNTRKAMGHDIEQIIVHNTFTQRKELKPYLDMAEEFGYDVQEITCKGGFGSVHNVPQATIDRMRNRWEN